MAVFVPRTWIPAYPITTSLPRNEWSEHCDLT
jgi:hypothetical protein